MYLSTTVGEVDDVEVEPEVGGDDLGGQRLARPRIAGEQRGHAVAARRGSAHRPLTEDELAVAGADRQLAQLAERVGGQDEVGPGRGRGDATREPFEAAGVLGPGAGRHVVRGDVPGVGRSDPAGGDRRAADLFRIEPEAGGGCRRIEAVAVELSLTECEVPRASPFVQAQERRVEHDRHVARPGRIPAPRAEQDHRAGSLGKCPDDGRAAFEDGLDRARDERRAAQPSLPDRRRGELRGIVAGGDAREVEAESGVAQGFQCGRCPRPPDARRPLTDVDQRVRSFE